MSKFLVTGGAGFIAGHITELLVEKGEDVIVFDNLKTGNLDNLAKVKDKIEFFKGDICNIDDLNRAMVGVDYVIHHAAEISVFDSLKDPIGAAEVNVMGTLKVLFAAKEAGVKRVTLASSAAVYGDTGDRAQREDFLPNPLSPYGASKICDEHYYFVFSQIYGIEAVVLRYFNVYGPRQNPKSQYAAVIPIFTDRVIHNQEIFINGDGEQTRDFVFVKDVARANYLAATKPGISGNVFNIATEENISVNALADKLIALSGNDIKVTHRDAVVGDIKYSKSDASKARDILGWKPLVSFDEGIKETFEYFKQKYL
ncbi:MAG: GDP-mannose 4,6-dehydratase [Abditibacteriota bacterium]|nr:GDP-mannose 4,6-dehydratase [Abditibacteriota bacterium]